MKRVLSLLTAFCLMVALVPTVYASEPDETNSVAIGYNASGEPIEYFQDLDTVYAAAKDVKRIELCKDITVKTSKKSGLSISSGISWGSTSVFDLNGHTITVQYEEVEDLVLYYSGIDVTSHGDPVTIQNGTILLDIPSGWQPNAPLGTAGISIFGNGGVPIYIEKIEMRLTDGADLSAKVAGIMLCDQGNSNTGNVVLNNNVIAVGDPPLNYWSEAAGDGKVTVESGYFENSSTGLDGDHIVLGSGSESFEIGDVAGLDGTVIAPPNTTTVIVRDNEVLFYDSLQDAVNDAKNGDTILLTKQPESDNVEIAGNKDLVLEQVNSDISINWEDIHLVTEDGEKVTVPEDGGKLEFPETPTPGPDPTPTPDDKPSRDNDDSDYYGVEKWDEVKRQIADADEGDTIKVSATGLPYFPSSVARELKGRDITLEIRKNGVTYTVNGLEIGAVDKIWYEFENIEEQLLTAEPEEDKADEQKPQDGNTVKENPATGR